MTRFRRTQEFIDCCKAHKLCTCATNEQYMNAADYYAILRFDCREIFDCKSVCGQMADLEPLVYMAWIISDTDKFTVNDVREILHTLL